MREMILNGKLAPGELLPVEHDLAEQLGVTRPTVREALRNLESLGLVERGPRRRMQVAIPSVSISSDAMKQAVMMGGITYRELWELNMALEPLAAELAAERIDEELLKRLEANLELTRSCINRNKALVAADIEFHELIAEAAGNKALILARAPLGDLMFSAYGAVVGKVAPGERLLEAHEKIYAAIKKGDKKTAHDWMVKHIHDFLRGCELAELPIDEPVRKVNKDRRIQEYSRETD